MLKKKKQILTHRQSRWRWVCFFIWRDLEKCSITSVAHQWILCSEWVPSEWESKLLIKHHNNPQVINTTSIHLLMSCEVKSCVFERKQIHHFDILTSSHCLWLKCETSIHVIAFSRDEVISSESGEKSAQIKHRLQAKTVLDFDVRGQQGMYFFHWRKH